MCAHTATHCNTLQHTYRYDVCTHCNTLQHTATHLSLRCVHTLQHTATHCNTLSATMCAHTATHCNTLQHTYRYDVCPHTANDIVYTQVCAHIVCYDLGDEWYCAANYLVSAYRLSCLKSILGSKNHAETVLNMVLSPHRFFGSPISIYDTTNYLVSAYRLMRRHIEFVSAWVLLPNIDLCWSCRPGAWSWVMSWLMSVTHESKTWRMFVTHGFVTYSYDSFLLRMCVPWLIPRTPSFFVCACHGSHSYDSFFLHVCMMTHSYDSSQILNVCAVCCNVLHYVAVCCGMLQCLYTFSTSVQCVAVCTLLQCVAVCCSVCANPWRAECCSTL